MKIAIVTLPGLEHQALWHNAMVMGLAKHGLNAHRCSAIAQVPPDADVVICWGWHVGADLRAAGHEVMVMERGYFGGLAMRRLFASIGWNGLNGRAEFRNDSVDVRAGQDGYEGTRFRRLFGPLMRPWRVQGWYALVMGQVRGDAATRHIDLERWYQSVCDELHELDIRRISFRPHPNDVHTLCPSGAKLLKGSLPEALRYAAKVITFNSNSGVDAIMAGVPVVALDEGSMAWPVARHSLSEYDWRSDRTAWACRMAWRQWSLDEVAAGDAWDHQEVEL